jgi:predicted alpha/beta-hydrolase family hydrolase
VPTQEREIDLGSSPGLLVRPRNARALLVLGHGAGAGMRHSFMAAIAQALAEHGIATLRYDFPYMAARSKRPDRPEVAEAYVRDVWRASKRLARGLPRFAGGKSYGGRMTVRAHAHEPLADLRGLVFLGFPLHPPNAPGTERAEHLGIAAGPMLFISGTRDDFAQLRLLKPVVKKLGARATLHLVDGAVHGFSEKPAMMEHLASTTATWVDTILDRA